MLLGSAAPRSLLDTILRSTVGKTARQGFGIADPYRAELREQQRQLFGRQNESESTGVFLDNLCSATDVPSSPRFAFGGTLTDCPKPCGCAPGVEENSDSSLSCSHCGLQVSSVRMTPLSHEKAMRLDEDPTAHADEPSAHCDDDVVRPMMHAEFGAQVETAEQLRQRTTFAVGGTRINKRTSCRMNLQDASNKIRRQAVRDHRTRGAVSERLDIFNRSVQKQLKIILDRAGMIEPLQKHIQTMTYRVLVASETHLAYCNQHPGTGCELDLFKKPPGVLAMVCTQVACQGLIEGLIEGHCETAVPGGMSTSELTRVLDNAKRVPIRTDTNQTSTTTYAVTQLLQSQRAATLSQPCAPVANQTGATVTEVAGSSAQPQRQHAQPSAAPTPNLADEPQPAQVQSPQQQHALAVDHEYSEYSEYNSLMLNSTMRQESHDLLPTHDVFFKIRDAVWAVCTLKQLASTLRSQAFDQLAKPLVSDWARTSGLPPDVSALLLLRCTLAKMHRHDSKSSEREREAIETVLRRTCDRAMISQSTALDEYVKVEPLIDTTVSSSASSIGEMLL